MGLPILHYGELGEERMVVAWVILTQCQRVTADGRTDLL